MNDNKFMEAEGKPFEICNSCRIVSGEIVKYSSEFLITIKCPFFKSVISDAYIYIRGWVVLHKVQNSLKSIQEKIDAFLVRTKAGTSSIVLKTSLKYIVNVLISSWIVIS